MAKRSRREGEGHEERCDICGRPASLVDYLVPGPVGNLCDECATTVHNAVERAKNMDMERGKFELPSIAELPKPKEIVTDRKSVV